MKLYVAAILALSWFFSVASAQTSNADLANPTSCVQPKLPSGFRFADASVNGAKLHYIIGGSGPGLILVHGFPEDSSAWLGLLGALGQHFTVAAPDMRGIGGSIAPGGAKFDGLTLAEDTKALAEQLGMQRPYIVGHDMGGIVSYSLARLYPGFVRGLMLIENPLPGVDPWDKIAAEQTTWHIHFHQARETPELLIAGREEAYFRMQFFEAGVGRSGAVAPAAITRYACAYSGARRLAAGLGQYRDVEPVAKLNTINRSKTLVPLNLVGGSDAFGPQMPLMARQLRRIGWSSVTVDQLSGASHYLVDERPIELSRLIIRYATPNTNPPAGQF